MATQDTELMLDVGQANEIKLAVRRAGGTNTDLKRLSEGDTFARILPFLRGLAEIKLIDHVIDLDADPFVPGGWKVEEHKKGGKWKFDPKKIKLYFSPNQMFNNTIVGKDLRKELANESVANASLLDWYWVNTKFIPEDWKRNVVFFWGTIYRDSIGTLYVRGLFWNGARWGSDYFWLCNDWRFDAPAVVLVS